MPIWSFSNSIVVPEELSGRRVPQLVNQLVLLFTSLLAIPLARQSCLDATLLTGLQIVGVTLHLFDNVLLLYLPLEPAQRIFERLAFLNANLCQKIPPPNMPMGFSMILEGGNLRNGCRQIARRFAPIPLLKPQSEQAVFLCQAISGLSGGFLAVNSPSSPPSRARPVKASLLHSIRDLRAPRRLNNRDSQLPGPPAPVSFQLLR